MATIPFRVHLANTQAAPAVPPNAPAVPVRIVPLRLHPTTGSATPVTSTPESAVAANVYNATIQQGGTPNQAATAASQQVATATGIPVQVTTAPIQSATADKVNPKLAGAVGGAALGFAVGHIPGAAIGAVLGFMGVQQMSK